MYEKWKEWKGIKMKMIEKKLLRKNTGLRYIGLICILLLGIYPGTSLAESVNIISNTGFETGISGWTFFTNGGGSFLNDASGAGSLHAGHVKVSTAGTNTQLYQKDLTLKPNTLYQLNFKAYSNTGHDLAVSLHKHISPYTIYGLSNKVVNLGTTWGSYSIQFTTSGFTGTVNDGRLKFNLGPYDAVGDQYFIDDVTLTYTNVSSPTVGKPIITTQPSSKTVVVGQTATFDVVATGTAPLSYQWQKNNMNIPGATYRTYTTPATSLSDKGATFRVVVSNSAGSVTSNAAILTVVSSTSSNKQLVVLDETYTHSTTVTSLKLLRTDTSGKTYSVSGKAFMKFNFPTGFPTGSMKTPVNYAGGTLYQRIQVITKPSSKPVIYQICLFQDQIIASKHACSTASKLAFSSTGTYYASQLMTSIFQYDHINWDRELLLAMTVLKDSNSNPIDDRYGFAGTWSGSPDFSLYYPMKVRYTAIIVPPGGEGPVWP